MISVNDRESERDRLFQALRAELLGPRGGSREQLPDSQDPRDEYITGVLAPQRSTREIEADERVLPAMADEERTSDELVEQDDESEDILPPSFVASPSLDPRSLPSSLGLSFIVSGGAPATIRLLFTWARYEKHNSHWQREPQSFQSEWLSVEQDHAQTAGTDVDIQVHTRPLPQGAKSISVFMLNVSPPTDYYRTEDLIFQPQIRVVLSDGASLVPLSNSPGVRDSTADAVNAAWRSRLSFARGHLCSAMWQLIDSETTPAESKAYAWIDGESVSQEVRDTYLRPAVRTEYLPSYEIRNPDFAWTSNVPSPVFSPTLLAESFDPHAIKRSLTPLVEGYREWIEAERKEPEPDPVAKAANEKNLQVCSDAAERIAAAIELLGRDETVRLAFCFANRAIAVQAEWNGVNLEWRPFQLAFILLNIPGIAVAEHPDREICDLLHFPTGGGKTEAYLALMAFAISLRRLRGRESGVDAGTAVISRYTLRLLTIQQFRRTARLIVACEYLRVQPNRLGGIGWLPSSAEMAGSIWGGTRFSIGLWVGGGVTPNGLVGFTAVGTDRRPHRFLGAIDLLKGARLGYDGPDVRLKTDLRGIRNLEGEEAEPAQLLECPACNGLLAIPEPSLRVGTHSLNFVVRCPELSVAPEPAAFSSDTVKVVSSSISPLSGAEPAYKILSITVEVREAATLRSVDIDAWFYDIVLPRLGNDARLESARPSRMGYFIDSRPVPLNKVTDGDFVIYCPSPSCILQTPSSEEIPLGERDSGQGQYEAVPTAFSSTSDSSKSVRIPIKAYTVDEQVYRRVPSVVIATVDKFASLTYEPAAAALFGNVDHYHARLGYYRQGCPAWVGDAPASTQAHPPDPRGRRGLHVAVKALPPPALIVQDELHLIDGPLGSMVGAFETITDALARNSENEHPVKYVASTATASHAEAQVRSVFNRDLRIFPPTGRLSHSNFFLRTEEGHPSEGARGRLYVGVAAVGRGPQTPLVRIWSRLLSQVGSDRADGVPDDKCDPYWTAVGYFNAIRELAGGRALLRADIPQRMGSANRQLHQDAEELSGRTRSLELPRMLDQLERRLPQPETVDALVTTSMFGTGIDIPRLGLMIVHGQPKTTAAYIQATGRVGRTSPALVVTFLRASRPRDLDHYEFFVGYHRALGRWVEPVTVAPFAPRTCERTLGPMQVALLRQARRIQGEAVSDVWRVEQRLKSSQWNSSAHLMVTERNTPIMSVIGQLLEARANAQPLGRRPPLEYVSATASNELDRWRAIAQRHDDPDGFVYREPAVTRPPTRAVVLGDEQHKQADLDRVFEDAPNSLREVEATVGIWVP